MVPFQDRQKLLICKYLSVNIVKDRVPVFEIPLPLKSQWAQYGWRNTSIASMTHIIQTQQG